MQNFLMKLYTWSQNHYHIRNQWYLFRYTTKFHVQRGKCLKTQNARGARAIAFAASFILTTHLLNASLKRKTDNIWIIVPRVTTAEKAIAVGMLQQYVSITLTVCIGHRSLNAGVRNAWRPKNYEFSLLYRKMLYLSAEDLDLLTYLSYTSALL